MTQLLNKALFELQASIAKIEAWLRDELEREWIEPIPGGSKAFSVDWPE